MSSLTSPSSPSRRAWQRFRRNRLGFVSLMIFCTLVVLSLFAEELGWRGGFWDWVAGLDLNVIGFVIVGMFVLTWLAALLVWRVGRIEERWAVQPEG